MGSQAGSVLLTPLRILKAPEALANRLRSMILLGEIGEGDSLPSEKDLVAQLAVSRATVREGLRILQSEGLITTRPGRGGGATVSRPTAHSHTRSLTTLLRFDGVTLKELLEARRALEPICGRLAADRITPAELDQLTTLVGIMKASTGVRERYLTAQIRFHLAIAEASHNSVLRIYASSLAEVAHREVEAIPFVEADFIAGAASCARIVEAVAAGNAPSAERRIARHLVAVEAAIERAGWPMGRQTYSQGGSNDYRDA